MKRAPKIPAKRVQNAEHWILNNPRATIAETMQHTGVSSGTVISLRKKLIEQGALLPFPHSKRKEKPEGAGIVAASTAELLKAEKLLDSKEVEAVLEGTLPHLSKETRRRKLEALVLGGEPDHVIRAEKALRDIEKGEGTQEEVGSPPPQTLDEGINEVSDMIEALAYWGGEKAVKQAVTEGLKRYYREHPRKGSGVEYGKTKDVAQESGEPTGIGVSGTQSPGSDE